MKAAGLEFHMLLRWGLGGMKGCCKAADLQTYLSVGSAAKGGLPWCCSAETRPRDERKGAAVGVLKFTRGNFRYFWRAKLPRKFTS